MRKFIRRSLTSILVAALSAILLAVVAEWFIEVVRDKGWYDNAGLGWDRAVSATVGFVTAPIILAPVLFLTGVVSGLWLDLFLMRKEAQAVAARTDIAENGLQEAINDSYKTIAMAIGNGTPMQQHLTIAAIEPFMLTLHRNKQLVTPDLRKNGESAGVYRSFLYLNYVAPPLRIHDFPEAKRRAEQIVPELNNMSEVELRRRID